MFGAHGSPQHSAHSVPVSLLTTLDRARAGEDAAVAHLRRIAQGQGTRYRQWTQTALEAETLDQALWSALWEALQTHPPKALRSLNGRGSSEPELVNPTEARL
jgi:hypothetical protein